jgi:hypothetical protein
MMREPYAEIGADLREFNGEQDQAYLLVRYRPGSRSPRWPIASRGVSAHYLRKEFTGRTRFMKKSLKHRPAKPLMRRLSRDLRRRRCDFSEVVV